MTLDSFNTFTVIVTPQSVLWKYTFNAVNMIKAGSVSYLENSTLLLNSIKFDARKSVFGVREQQIRRPACASAQSDQRLC